MEELKDIAIAPESVQEFSSWLEGCGKFIITAHTHPDGDAVGSTLALYHFLKSKGKDVTVCLPTPFPDFLKWMPGADLILIAKAQMGRVEKLLAETDVICMLDFNAMDRLDCMAEAVQGSKARKILIDHHLDPAPIADVIVSFPQQSSTCELLYRFLDALGHADGLTKAEATSLYTGMMTDTGGFTYNSSRPEIFSVISRLLRTGIDKDLIYRKVNYNYSAGRLQLQGKVLSSLQVIPDYHASLMTLSREDQKQYKSLRGDSEGFVNLPLQIKEVILSCFLREDTDKDQVKISLRSVGDFPCNKLAAEFGGGGHLNASGAEVMGATVEEVAIRMKVLLMKYAPLLQECYKKAPK